MGLGADELMIDALDGDDEAEDADTGQSREGYDVVAIGDIIDSEGAEVVLREEGPNEEYD